MVSNNAMPASAGFWDKAGIKAKSASNFVGGGWSDDFGEIVSQQFGKELGLTTKGTKFFNSATWQTASENLRKFDHITDTSLYKSPISTIKQAYTGANAAVVEQAATNFATEATTSPGVLGKMASGTGKILDPVVKPVANALSKIPGVSQGCEYVGKLGKSCKLPGIGSILMVAGETPTVENAFAKGGIGEGGKQIVRSTGNLAVSCGAFATGSAIGGTTAGIIGQVLCPIPGLGFILGAGTGIGLAYLAEKVTKPVLDGVLGQSFAEKQEVV
ncbi:MAG: hypothetical protein WC197_04450 [Candidatus Gastranaerophilaceae bacterium]|jgi:hypothetical protein